MSRQGDRQGRPYHIRVNWLGRLVYGRGEGGGTCRHQYASTEERRLGLGRGYLVGAGAVEGDGGTLVVARGWGVEPVPDPTHGRPQGSPPHSTPLPPLRDTHLPLLRLMLTG